jgi:hypothetical protein
VTSGFLNAAIDRQSAKREFDSLHELHRRREQQARREADVWPCESSLVVATNHGIKS